MPDPSLWTRIGNRVPRVATLAIGLLALFGLSVIRLVLVMIPRDPAVMVNGYLDGTAAGILWLGCAIWLPVCAAAVVVSIARRQWKALIGRVVLFVCAAFVGLWSLVSVGFLGTKLPFSVVRAPKRGVYYALCDREYAWALRTGQVEAILKEHGGAAP